MRKILLTLLLLMIPTLASAQAVEVGWFDKSRFSLSAGFNIQDVDGVGGSKPALGLVPAYTTPVSGLSIGGGVFREFGDAPVTSWYVGARLRLWRGSLPKTEAK